MIGTDKYLLLQNLKRAETQRVMHFKILNQTKDRSPLEDTRKLKAGL